MMKMSRTAIALSFWEWPRIPFVPLRRLKRRQDR